MSRVVITGLGIVAPNGIGMDAFWRASAEGRSCTRREPEMAALGMKSTVVASVDDFNLAAHHAPEHVAELSRLSRFVQMAVTAGAMAARQAGLPARTAAGLGGVIFSSAIGGTPEFQQTYEELSDHGRQPVRPVPPSMPFCDSVFLNYPPAWLASRYQLSGPCTSLTTGCTAGIDALGLAFEMVRGGDLALAIAAAAEAPLCGLSYATLDVIGSLAVNDSAPERASRPFDACRSGFVLGEASAAVVLEDAAHAAARNARELGEICGFSSLNNAFHMSDLASDGEAMAQVIRDALRDANAAPSDIDYVNAHGSSTPQNDVFETQAFKTVFGEECAKSVPISSTKSMIGHSLSAASLVGIIAAIGAMRYSIVPPTINLQVPDPRCDLDYVPNRSRWCDVSTALVTASGFGGIHSAAVLRRSGRPDQAPWTHAAPSAAPSAGSSVAAAR